MTMTTISFNDDGDGGVNMCLTADGSRNILSIPEPERTDAERMALRVFEYLLAVKASINQAETFSIPAKRSIDELLGVRNTSQIPL